MNKRNFSIIAHIDHGKSTLADRILELTDTVSKRDMKEQLLDSMELEREKGITIKAKATTLKYKAKNGEVYTFNLIDTPGHVDFTYEVSRALAACEGALLIVDSTQGVEAQTLANVYLALENNLEILPVINKVDLQNSDVEATRKEIEDIIGLDTTNAVLTSGKSGLGVAELLEKIVEYIPAPEDTRGENFRALIFDSHFDEYRGVITYIRVKDGVIRKGDKVQVLSTRKELEITETGIFTPTMVATEYLEAGDVGYIVTGIKNIKDTTVGDTLAMVGDDFALPVTTYRAAQPMVFAGVYPLSNDDYKILREALEKLQLNDAALTFEPETSTALGFGFRVGFLGLLHMEIILERLRREYDLDIISTAPSVEYQVYDAKGEMTEIDNPMDFATGLTRTDEPFIKGKIMVPKEYVGRVMELCQEKRGIYVDMNFIDDIRTLITYELPLAEVIIDFYDKLKSGTKGYASFEYEFIGYKESNLSKVDILVAGDIVDAFSFIVHRDFAEHRSRAICEKLKELIPRQQFEVAIQASLGSRIIARETIRAMRKDVLAKCYGGDISRKRKLLDKQKEGKKRMKSIGNVEIPQEAFFEVLKLD